MGGNIIIGSNDLIINVDGLNNLSQVDFNITIRENALLSNLNGLSNIQTVDGFLKIFENTTLSDLCGLETLLIGNGLGGSYEVYDNAYNPTQQDIIDGNCSI